MDTSASLDVELRKATAERQKQPGHRCLGRQRDDGYALIVGVPTACFTPPQLRSIADIVERYGSVSHLSTAQSMIILGISRQNYYPARQAVLEAGFQVRSVGRDVYHVKCCPGADFSPFGLQRTFDLVTHLEETFRGLPLPAKVKISVSGCANCCAGTRLNDFGIHATSNGWRIFIGGKMGLAPVVAQMTALSVSADEVPRHLAAVLRAYRELAQPRERLYRTIERLGLEEFKSALEPFLDLPYDDLAAEAKQARQEMEQAECIGPVDSQRAD
jgi:NAD(P)H-nitrite reductase large subunit